MKLVVALLLFTLLAYLVYSEVSGEVPSVLSRGRLCDHITVGSVYEDVSTALKRGVRLLELHVYSDEQDHPVVAKKPLMDGYDYAEDNVSFNSCCVDIANDGFPSTDPLILSLVVHTTKSITMDRMAETLLTTVRKHLTSEKEQTKPIDEFANKLVIVSGGAIHGTKLEELVNFSWSNSNVRRLTFQQAVHPRDEDELMHFNVDNLSIVAPPSEMKIHANPDRPKALGCQWIVTTQGAPGFLSRALNKNGS
jgi:hypothetical protein